MDTGVKTQAPQQSAQVPVAQPSLVQLPSKPGVRRDGTSTDSDFFNDTQWCRFNLSGRPRKMGGFKEASSLLSGPVYGGFLFSRQFLHMFCAFSKHGVEYTMLDAGGVGSVVSDITPASYVYNENTLWGYDYLFDAASGADATLLIAAPTHTLQNIDDPFLGKVYVTPLNNPAQMTEVADARALVSGGLFCTAPYTVLLGNDGNVTWSDANAPQTYSSGDAGSARVTGSKLVKGLPMRTGVSSGGLLWSLDSVLRMDYVGGAAIFKFSHISTKSSILSSRSVIEYDGKWYWAGIDRFMVTNGIQVDELPNDMNLNWFYDNLNFEQRQKVFAMKMPRYGEIWWCFPFGDSVECNKAVIYNVRLKTWYDVSLSRCWGFTPASYRYPLMLDSFESRNQRVTLSVSAGTLQAGFSITGATSGAMGFIVAITGSGPYSCLLLTNNSKDFEVGEGFSCGNGAAGAVTAFRNTFSLFTHENGYDAVIGDDQTAIESSFTTCDFGAPTGGPQLNAVMGADVNTRIKRVEPDFNMSGPMTMQILSRQFAQSAENNGKLYTFEPNTDKIDLREQAREFRLKFSSNSLGGFYEGGKTLVHLEPGDARP